jgi:hypothetical protein
MDASDEGDAAGTTVTPEGGGEDTLVPAAPEEDAGALTFTPLGRAYRLTLPVQGKMVSDLFDPAYGRETAALGVDAPLSASGTRTAVPYSAIDPATEYLSPATEAAAPELGDGTQIWRITHDGTVSHSVTFGGFSVQVLSRARREGAVRPPDPGELGWKDTLRVDPLESVLVAMRPVLAAVPFPLPAGERPLDITRPLGAEGPFTQLDQLTAEPLQPQVVNATADFSFEVRWGIHLIGGEESQAARPVVLQATAAAPADVTATAGDGGVVIAWTPPLFPPPVVGYQLQRAADEGFRESVVPLAPSGTATSFTDTGAPSGATSFYRVRTVSAAGWSPWSPTAEVDVP